MGLFPAGRSCCGGAHDQFRRGERLSSRRRFGPGDAVHAKARPFRPIRSSGRMRIVVSGGGAMSTNGMSSWPLTERARRVLGARILDDWREVGSQVKGGPVRYLASATPLMVWTLGAH